MQQPLKSFAEAPKDLLLVADYLRGSESQLKNRQGIFNGRRVDFFKGKHAVNALMRDPYKKNAKRPAVGSREDAFKLVQQLHGLGFFLRVDKEPKAKVVTLQPIQAFAEEAYFVWIYQGSQIKGTLIGLGVLALVFAGVLFPLWPSTLRLGVYYLSLAVLGLMGLFMALAVFRLILWVVLVVFTGRGGWLFPNLFEDVSVVDSFKPLWGWDPVKVKKGVAGAPAGSGQAKEGHDD